MRALLFFAALLVLTQWAWAQKTGVLRGMIRDKETQETLVGVSIKIEGTTLGTSTDMDGNFKVENIPVGSYNVRASLIGYKPLIKYNINITSGNAQILSFELEEDVNTLGEVEVTADRTKSPAVGNIITPLSVQSLTTEEIRSNPGGNFDISRVVQVLPGVAGATGVGGFRNDIIIRGGAPNENVYYLDGIEIPVINHFTTQGSAGGPQGILNVSFIEDVKLSSSAFDARYDNALASVFQFKQREGNPDRFSGNVRLSGTELAGTFEGPMGPKTNYLASVRRSYLQYLFQALDLPIRPNYWDFQYKVTHKLNAKTTLTALGIAAIDEFSFAQPRESTPENDYVLRANPTINQWNYTVGFSIKRLLENGYLNIALSRNAFDNALDRFEDRREGDEAFRALRARSRETENKLRIDVNKNVNGWKFSYGVMAQYVEFSNNLFSRLRREVRDPLGNIVQPGVDIRFDAELGFWRYGAFGQVSRSLLNNRLGLSFGLRSDMNSFTDSGNNPLETLSPRLSATYALNNQWNINASIGSYYKLPIYTVLGYRDASGEWANRNARYTQSIHYVAGLEYLPKESLRFTLEGFYKDYRHYPVSLRDGISLANQGGNFGAIGNEAVQTNGTGRAYGFEFYVQQKLTRNIFAVFSYTFVRSEFAGFNGVLVPSAWDNRHLISALFGRKFKKGWEIGMRYRFAGGAPFTPFDQEASRRNFLSTGQGILDFGQLNTIRLGDFNQFDFRIDKKWNFRRTTFDLYLDVVNAFVIPNPAFPQYTFQRTPDGSAFATTDGQPIAADGSNAIPVILRNDDPVVLPTIGFIVEF